MAELRRRTVKSLVFVTLLVVFYTLLYQWALASLEGVQVTVFDSLQVVIETLTTAGFGGDTIHWTTAPMNLIVVGMNLTGVLLVFLALPLFVVPLIQQAQKTDPQRKTDLTDHVIICSYNPRQDVLRSELEAADVPYVIVEDDPQTVVQLNEEGIEAIVGDPEAEETVVAANIETARALVADVSDEENVSVILTARELREDLRIVSIAEDEQDAVYHRYAGANRVIRPREALGNALASKVMFSLTHELQDTIELGSDFELSELLVKEHSQIAGKTLAEVDLRNQLDATVIGVWSSGEFVAGPDPDLRIEPNAILLVAGSHRSLERVSSRATGPKSPDGDRVVVVGYGVVGQAVADRLRERDISRTVVDVNDVEGVDVVGDVTDQDTRDEAALEDARFVVVALNDDTETMYTTVALEQCAANTEVLARANDVENTRKLYRAGAEYVLALSTVTGRMLSSVLLEDEEILAPETQFEILRMSAPALVGTTLGKAGVRDRTGATVVAIERDGDLLTSPGPDTRVAGGDVLVIAGDDEAVNTFIETYK